MDLFKRIQRSIAGPYNLNSVPRFLIIKATVDRILRMERLHVNGIYLDIGCANGNASILLSDNFSERVNLDIQRSVISNCKQNCAKAGVKTHFIVADARRLPFKGMSFEVVSAFSLIEHLPDHSALLTEVNGVLAENGICVLQFPNGNFLIELHSGIPLPALIPGRVKNFYFRHLLHGTGEFPVWNLTKREIIRICEPLFRRVYIESCNYDERSIPFIVKPVYKVFRKLKLLDICPLGWVVVCRGRVKSQIRHIQR